ncbi:SPOR domain-containing protein [Thiolapillus sp.]|uniref:SPOR domain-containing protein n=1 Tax=Thiolapillus sp. TaxID=2017437 RepID=UPI003AF758FA
MSALKARIAKLERRKSSVRKTKASAAKSGWAVNLISFKQEWYAQRKSAELKKKGIPVEVLPVKIKGENWYRLRVAGFKTKNEASSYAVRVKKSHMQN